MSQTWGRCCVLSGVYFMIFFSFAAGALYIFGGVKLLQESGPAKIGPGAIGWGIFVIITGIILLTGVILGNARCVLVYLTLTVLGLLVLTIYVFYFGIRNYTKFQFDLYLIWNFGVNIVFLCIASAHMFCVYFFYKDLAQKNRVVITTDVRIILE